MKLFKLPEINKEKILSLLPSKKFGFYVLIAISVPLFAFIFFSSNGVVNRIIALVSNTKTPKQIAALQAEASRDSDNDGLDDWQEALWKTDYKNPDTDGDGTKDGDEVAANRNPLVAGPNDSLTETFKLANQNIANMAGDNITEEISKSVLTKYVTTKKVLGGTKVTPEVENQITESVLAEMDFTANPSKIYVMSDLKISQDNSPAAIREYGNTVGKIAIGYATAVDPVNDMAIAKDALQTGSRAKLASLENSVRVYEQTIEKILNVSVPSSLQTKHLNTLNVYNRIKENTANTTLYFSDPMKAVIAIGNQGMEIKNLIESFISINGIMESLGILFKNSEPGFFIQNNVNNLPR